MARPVPTSQEAPLIAARDLAMGFAGRAIVRGIQLQLHRGDRWGIIGPNGAGKTTLARTLMGALAPVSGEVVRRPGLRFGYVKQRDALHDLYPFTVGEVVSMGRYRGFVPRGRLASAERDAVQEAMARTGIAALRDRPVRDLSGGQKQRVLIARALCAEPDIILLDEPTNDMDIAGEESVLSLILDLHRHTGAAVVIISHLLHAVLRIAENILFVGEGQVTAHDRESFLADKHLERYYGIPIRIAKYPDGTYSVAAARHLRSDGRDTAC